MHKDLEEIKKILKRVPAGICSIRDAEIVLSKVCQETTEKSRMLKTEEYFAHKHEMELAFSSFLSSVIKNCNETQCEDCLIAKWCNSYRLKKQEFEVKRDALVYADFFCGAGGLSWGFHRAGYRMSIANRQRIIDDPRNHLYKSYVSAIDILRPKFFVMENVRGMLGVKDQIGVLLEEKLS